MIVLYFVYIVIIAKILETNKIFEAILYCGIIFFANFKQLSIYIKKLETFRNRTESDNDYDDMTLYESEQSDEDRLIGIGEECLRSNDGLYSSICISDEISEIGLVTIFIDSRKRCIKNLMSILHGTHFRNSLLYKAL